MEAKVAIKMVVGKVGIVAMVGMVGVISVVGMVGPANKVLHLPPLEWNNMHMLTPLPPSHACPVNTPLNMRLTGRPKLPLTFFLS